MFSRRCKRYDNRKNDDSHAYEKAFLERELQASDQNESGNAEILRLIPFAPRPVSSPEDRPFCLAAGRLA